MSVSVTGTQHRLVLDDQEAVVTELGATLRSYRVAGRDVVTTFTEDQSPFGSQGQHLMPWPNRVRDGRWVHEGTQHQLPISEPERSTAIHGLVCWVPWTTEHADETSVAQTYLLHPQPGWPGLVRLRLVHRLTPDGLVVDVSAHNLGSTAIPFGYGAHPYLVAPEGHIDQCTLEVPFATLLTVDPRLLPVERQPVDGTVVDLRSPKLLAGIGLDTAFTDPVRDEHGLWGVVLRGGGRATTLWGDRTMGWVQLYTPGDGVSVAVEPMTCGPDALNPGPTHDDLVVLEPGQEFAGSWGISHRSVEG